MRARASDRHLHNVPAELTSFVGRRQELAAVRQRLSTARLLTLTGPGGVGKTRLAIRACADLVRAFPDGIWFVDLAGVTDTPLITQAVFHALGVQDSGTGWSLATLADHLGGRRLLLVVDDCEHLLDGCAVMASTLLSACPDLRILATSREPLGIDGEHRLRIAPLTVPDEDTAPPETLLDFDSLALLAARAGAVDPAFELDATNVAAAVRLCRRLDGIPLAIELAAARLEAVGLDELNETLDREPLALQPKRGGAPRHRTLEATIDWSYRLLTDRERRLWARLSVFAGAFDAAAAVDVCADADQPAVEIPDLLGALVEKSVLRRDAASSPARYVFLETLRQFGRQRLRESGLDELEAQRRHRDWVLGLARDAGTWDRRQAPAFARLEVARNDVWSALSFCARGPDDAATGIEICCRLYAYWNSHGPLNDARRVIGALLDVVPEESLARAQGSWLSAGLAIWQGDYPAGQGAAEESLRIARMVGDAEATAWAIGHLGVLAWAQGRPADARPLVTAAIEIATANEAIGTAYWARSLLSAVDLALGDPAGAVTSGDEVVALGAASGELWARGIVLGFVAEAHWQRGEWDRAIAALREGFECKRALGDRIGMASRLEAMAWMLAQRSAARGAAMLLGCAATMRRSIGPVFPAFAGRYERSVSSARSQLGDAAYEAAYAEGAALSADEALASALGDRAPVSVRPQRPSPGPSRTTSVTLTPREREVASLVGEGLTNREIAERLVVSERTAETHVWNIFNKLGLSSRSQLASWATAHGMQSTAAGPGGSR